MKKKRMIVLVCLIICGFFIYLNFYSHKGVNLVIKNQTDNKTHAFVLKTKNIVINIHPISIGEVYKRKEIPIDEDSDYILLEYKDSKGKKHVLHVIGKYIGGYDGKAEVILKSIDANGDYLTESSYEIKHH